MQICEYINRKKYTSEGSEQFSLPDVRKKIQNLPVFLQSATFYIDLHFGLKGKKKKKD